MKVRQCSLNTVYSHCGPTQTPIILVRTRFCIDAPAQTFPHDHRAKCKATLVEQVNMQFEQSRDRQSGESDRSSDSCAGLS